MDNVRQEKRKIFYIIPFLLLTIFYVWYHQRVILSSDSTTMLPLAMDWLSGNFLLKDWVVGTDDFFFSETIFYIPGLALDCSCYKLLYLVPSMVLSLLVVYMLYIFVWNNKIVNNIMEKLLLSFWYVAFVGVLAHPTAYTLLNANSHNNAYVFMLVEIVLLELFIDNKKIRYIVLYVLIGTLVMFSEGIMLMVLIAPVCSMCLYCMIKNILCKDEKDNNSLFILFWSTGAIYILSMMLEKAIEKRGGLIDAELEFSLVSPAAFFQRLNEYRYQALLLWGAELSADGSVKSSVYNVIILIILIATILIFIWKAYEILRGRITRKELILWLIVFFNIAGCLLIDRAVFYRYLVPGYLFGMILLFLNVYKGLCKLPFKIKIAVLILISIGGIYVAGHRIEGIKDVNDVMQTSKEVADVIEKRNWGNGYGDFWSASVNACFMNFENNIYPIEMDENGITPYSELIKNEWYYEKNIHYIIINADDNENIFCKEVTAQKVLGDPDEMVIIGKYKIMYWDKDLSEFMRVM